MTNQKPTSGSDPSHRRLRNFRDKANQDDVLATLKRIAASLKGSELSMTVQFRIRGPRGEEHYCLKLSNRECNVREGKVDQPTLTMGTYVEAWLKIVGGELAPWDALNNGDILLDGNFQAARQLTAALAIPDDG